MKISGMYDSEDGRSVSRAMRLARLAADETGQAPEEHLGDAWMVSRERCSNQAAVGEIIRRNNAGVIADDQRHDGIDPDAVGACWRATAETAEPANEASLRRYVWQTLQRIPERQHYVLARRYGLGGLRTRPAASVNDLADEMSISAARLRQIEDKAIRSLRRHCIRHGMASWSGDECIYRTHAPERWRPSTVLPEKTRWEAAMLEAGGRPDRDLWGWHACPLALAAIAVDPGMRPHAMLEAPPCLDAWGRPLQIRSRFVGGLRMTFIVAGGVVLTMSIEFISGARYELRRWSDENGRLRIEGDLHLPPIPSNAAKSLCGRPVASITDHWALQGDLRISGVQALEQGSVFSITGRTRQIEHGAGCFIHPMGLSCP